MKDFDPNYASSVQEHDGTFQFFSGLYWDEDRNMFRAYAPEPVESRSISKLCKIIGIDEDDAEEAFDRFREILRKTRSYWMDKWTQKEVV